MNPTGQKSFRYDIRLSFAWIKAVIHVLISIQSLKQLFTFWNVNNIRLVTANMFCLASSVLHPFPYQVYSLYDWNHVHPAILIAAFMRRVNVSIIYSYVGSGFPLFESLEISTKKVISYLNKHSWCYQSCHDCNFECLILTLDLLGFELTSNFFLLSLTYFFPVGH